MANKRQQNSRPGGSGGGQSGSSSHRTGHVTMDKGTQTDVETTPYNEMGGDASMDALLVFKLLPEPAKVETLCELVAALSPLQLRLVHNCMAGVMAAHQTAISSHEKKMNEPAQLDAIAQRSPLKTALDALWPGVCVLAAGNRQAASAYERLLNQVAGECERLAGTFKRSERRSQLETLLSCYIAVIHHPAFIIDQRIRAEAARDAVASRLHDLDTTRGPSSALIQVLPEMRSPSDSNATLKSLRAVHHLEEEQEIAIELLWTDDMTTYVNRSRTELERFHRQLLDEYGMEMKNDRQRTIPYFPSAAAPLSAVAAYVDGLSNLPARMLLDQTFCREFRSSRHKSSGLVSGTPSHASYKQYMQSGVEGDAFAMADNHHSLPYLNDLALGVLPRVDVPDLAIQKAAANTRDFRLNLPPSCPHCAGQHTFSECPRYSADFPFSSSSNLPFQSTAKYAPRYNGSNSVI